MTTAVHPIDRSKRENFSNRKFYAHDFSNRDLSHADFRGATLSECLFRETDLSYATFAGANCFRADFTGARLYRTSFENAIMTGAIFKPKDCFGITMTMTCESFNALQVDPMWFYGWLFLATQMKLPEDAEHVRKELIAVIGAERFQRLKAVFEKRFV